jgi:hypothetical protein
LVLRNPCIEENYGSELRAFKGDCIVVRHSGIKAGMIFSVFQRWTFILSWTCVMMQYLAYKIFIAVNAGISVADRVFMT